MSLDKNLFTLTVVPDVSKPNIADLVDPTGSPHYKKERVNGPLYRIDILDPLSGALLATATAPDVTSKTKVIELFNPSHVVEMKSVGTLSFKWAFKWEDHEFEWKREECYMVRKPDPAVLVAVTKEPPGRLRSTTVQILDYNLHRFDIEDRKGLEITLLTALLTFHDLNDVHNAPPPEYASPNSPPSVPPKPAGLDRIAEMQAARGEVNEVTVGDESEIGDYAAYAVKLLGDEAILFITIRSEAAAHVPRVLAVVEETRRLQHKLGSGDDLHQYVVYDTKQPARRGRINLNDPTPGSSTAVQYTPPESLVVHLSKIDMPELMPRGTPSRSTSTQKTAPQYPPPKSNPTGMPRTPPSTNPSSTPKSSPPGSPAPSSSTKHDRPTFSRLLKFPTSRAPAPAPAPTPPTLPPPSTRPTQPYPQTAYSSAAPSSSRRHPAPVPSPAQLSNPTMYMGEPTKAPSRSFWGTKR